MTEPPSRRPSIIDLIAFLAVVAAGVFLIVEGASAGTAVSIFGAMSTLYATWTVNGQRRTALPPQPPADARAQPEEEQKTAVH